MTLQALPVPSMPKRFAASASTWKLSPGKGPVRQRRLVPPKRSDTEDAFSNDLGRLASATGGSTVTCDRAHDQAHQHEVISKVTGANPCGTCLPS